MHRKLQIIIVFVFIVNCVHKTFADNCNALDNLSRAFNLGEHVFLEYNSNSYMKFDSQYKRLVDRQFSVDSIFGDTFLWVDTAFTFAFSECDTISRTQTYCDSVGKADGLVIVTGKRKRDLSYGYEAYRKTESGQLVKLAEDPDVWGLKASGHMTEDFWQIQGLKMSRLYYRSSIFVRSRNELFVTILDTIKFSNNLFVMSRKLEADGQWSPWTEIPKIAFNGMFDINRRIFGLDRSRNAYEFVWNTDNDITFDPISNTKELFNCFDNSTLGQPLTSPLTFTSTISTPTTSTTHESSAEPFVSSSSVESSSSDGSSSIEPEVESNEIETSNELSTEQTKEQVTVSEVELLVNSSLPEQELNQRLEESDDDSHNWSIVFIIAIIALLAAIIIAVILIVRNKSRTRVLYLNSKSDETKSCEIPLNNNTDDNEVRPKDTDV